MRASTGKFTTLQILSPFKMFLLLSFSRSKDYTNERNPSIDITTEQVHIVNCVFEDINSENTAKSIISLDNYELEIRNCYLSGLSTASYYCIYAGQRFTLHYTCIQNCKSTSSAATTNGEIFNAIGAESKSIDTDTIVGCSNIANTFQIKGFNIAKSNFSNNSPSQNEALVAKQNGDIYLNFFVNSLSLQVSALHAEEVQYAKKLVFYNNSADGLYLSNSPNFNIYNSYFINTGKYDIHFDGSSATAENCSFTNLSTNDNSKLTLKSGNEETVIGVPKDYYEYNSIGAGAGFNKFCFNAPLPGVPIHTRNCVVKNDRLEFRKRYKRVKVIFSLASTFEF